MGNSLPFSKGDVVCSSSGLPACACKAPPRLHRPSTPPLGPEPPSCTRLQRPVYHTSPLSSLAVEGRSLCHRLCPLLCRVPGILGGYVEPELSERAPQRHKGETALG